MRGKRKTQSAIQQSLSSLARREHTDTELAHKLRSKGYTDDQIEQALKTLRDQSLLSHERFMDDYIRNAERKGYGPVKVRWELKHRKQLAGDEIDAAMDRNQADWVASARRCCDRKFGHKAAGDSKERLRRQRYLSSRGFPADIVCQVLSDE